MKDKNVAAILAFFFGGVGAHKFYLGQIGSGILYLAFCWTFIPAIISFVEFIILAVMDRDEFNRRFNGHNMLPGAPMVVNMLPPSPYYPQPPPPPYGYGPQPGPYGYGQPPMPGYPQPPYPGYGQQGPGMGGHPHPGGPQPQPQGQSQGEPIDVVAKLEKLNELRIAGLLTDEEFAAQKSRILDRL